MYNVFSKFTFFCIYIWNYITKVDIVWLLGKIFKLNEINLYHYTIEQLLHIAGEWNQSEIMQSKGKDIYHRIFKVNFIINWQDVFECYVCVLFTLQTCISYYVCQIFEIQFLLYLYMK